MNSVATDSTQAGNGSRVALALAAVYLIWGSTYLGIRFALEGGFPPFLLGGIRFLIDRVLTIQLAVDFAVENLNLAVFQRCQIRRERLLR